jgi:hypothetical protein
VVACCCLKGTRVRGEHRISVVIFFSGVWNTLYSVSLRKL